MLTAFDYPYRFVTEEMIKFANYLSNPKKNDFDVAYYVFEMTSSRVVSKSFTLMPFKYRCILPAYQIWDGGVQSSMNQAMLFISLLLLTKRFQATDIELIRESFKFGFRMRKKIVVLLTKKDDKNIRIVDLWSRKWNVARINLYDYEPIKIPKILCGYSEKIMVNGELFYKVQP